MVNYILSLESEKEIKEKMFAIEGTIEFKEHIGLKIGGEYILTASYTDKGNPGQPESMIISKEQVVFKAPKK